VNCVNVTFVESWREVVSRNIETPCLARRKPFSSLSGILMCLPIFDSGSPSFDDYLNQFIDTTLSSCNYDTQEGTLYSSPDYQQLQSVSLNNCIKTCCGDPNCVAYTFQNGTCHMKNTNNGLTNVEDKSYKSGSIDRNHPRAASQTPNAAPQLSSLFFGWKGDTRQSSIAYATCFETIENNQPESHSIYVFYFANGIHLAASTFQQLKGAMNGSLSSYQAPPAIRGTKPTLLSYRFDQNGNKVVTDTSDTGVIYKTALSSCSDEFANRFEYFLQPPNLPQFSSKIQQGQHYYTTSQYKCVPFNQLSDMSGEYIIPGNRDLKTLMGEQQRVSEKQTNPNPEKPKISIVQMEQIIGGTIAGVVFIIGGIFIAKTIASNSGE